MSSYINEIHLHSLGSLKAHNGTARYVHLPPIVDKKKGWRTVIEIVYDPIKPEDGGLRTGAKFRAMDWKYTLTNRSASDNTIVRVLPNLQSNGEDPKWEPGIYRCVTLRQELPEDIGFYAPAGGKRYMKMLRLETIAELRAAIKLAKRRNGNGKHY